MWCLVDLLSGLELLMGNNLQAVDLQQVKIEVEVSKERKTATIEKATPSHAHVKAGESVDVEVLIRPYRGQPETRTLRLQIPPDTAEGLLTVTVRSGAESYFATKPRCTPASSMRKRKRMRNPCGLSSPMRTLWTT